MIYLDHNATSPVLPDFFEAMRPYFCEEWGNPSSAYKFGSKLKGGYLKPDCDNSVCETG
jgi:cysteine desulfurase